MDQEFLGQADLQGGQEFGAVPAADASLIVPLASPGPAVYRVDLPGWSASPVILAARSVKASVSTASDGSVLVRPHLLGSVYGRARLMAAGLSDAMLGQRIGSAPTVRADRLLTHRRAGVDPRALADRPWPRTAALILRPEV